MKNLTKNFFSVLALAFITSFSFTSCGGGTSKSEGKTKKGIIYTIFSKNTSNKKAVAGDFFYFFVTVKNHKDSIIQKRQEVKGYEFKKDTADKFYEIFAQLRKGDSVVIKEPTDNLIKEQENFMKQRIAQTRKQLEEIKENKDKKYPDSIRTQYMATLEKDIAQAEEQMKQENPMMPKGKSVSYIIAVTDILNKDENIKRGEKDRKEAEEKQRKAQQDAEKKAGVQLEKDDAIIKEYLEKNKLNAKKTASGLYYIIETEGTGENPKIGQTIAVNYKGQLLSGKVFDTSIKAESEKAGLKQPGRTFEPLKFPVGQQQVIKGWDEGLMLFKKGGKGTLIIPSPLAYGERGAGADIPANAVLRFDVELVDIVAQEEKKK